VVDVLAALLDDDHRAVFQVSDTLPRLLAWLISRTVIFSPGSTTGLRVWPDRSR